MNSTRARPIAVDAMGGDEAPQVLIDGATLAHQQGIGVVLFGDEARIRPHVGATGLDIVHCATAVGMDDPATAVRQLEDSSMRSAMRSVARGECGAMVTCGNTGAALLAAIIELGTLEGVTRPAVMAKLPTVAGRPVYLLDAGASVSARGEHLVSWALLGAARAAADGVHEPKVGVLSNGTEAHKGTPATRQAQEALRDTNLVVVGNVEPHQVFRGDVDVVVCDGFSGNILLKTAEAVVSLGRARLETVFRRGPLAKLAGWWVRSALQQTAHALEWEREGAALLAGVCQPVWIGHGNASAEAVCAAIRRAHYAEQGNLAAELSTQFARFSP